MRLTVTGATKVNGWYIRYEKNCKGEWKYKCTRGSYYRHSRFQFDTFAEAFEFCETGKRVVLKHTERIW